MIIMKNPLLSNRKTKWLIILVLGFSFMTLSLASACMVPDWVPKADDCCVLPCKNVSSPELARSYCDLSNQQRSLHAGPQLPSPAVLVEDGLALIVQSLKAPPPPVFSSLLDSDHPIKQSQQDLCILHRTFLL